jgi:hypothetical protein
MPTWQSSMTHIALEGGCFVLSAIPFTRRKDYPPPPDYTFGGLEEEPSPESVICSGGSVIISPSGTVLAGPNYEGEALLTADLGKLLRNQVNYLRDMSRSRFCVHTRKDIVFLVRRFDDLLQKKCCDWETATYTVLIRNCLIFCGRSWGDCSSQI